MAKIEIEVPDNIVEFIKIAQKYYGNEGGSIEEFVRMAICSSCKADLDSMPLTKRTKLVRKLRLGNIVMSPWMYKPEDLVVGEVFP